MKKHHERLVQIGMNIAFYRKLRGMTQLDLAEMVDISRGHMSTIEAPNMDTSLSFETFFDIADALGVAPEKLLEYREIT